MSETQTRAGNEHMTAGWDEGAELCGIHKPRLGSLTPAPLWGVPVFGSFSMSVKEEKWRLFRRGPPRPPSSLQESEAEGVVITTG